MIFKIFWLILSRDFKYLNFIPGIIVFCICINIASKMYCMPTYVIISKILFMET